MYIDNEMYSTRHNEPSNIYIKKVVNINLIL